MITRTRFGSKRASVALVAALVFVFAQTASAREYSSADKFGRGVTNMTLGVLAWPGEMAQQSKERGPALGIPIGFFTGLGWFAARELVGVYEFITCVFEFPPRFEPILEPDHPWQYFEDL